MADNVSLQDVLIAVVDGLKGFPEGITAAFPQATVQTCIVHLVRHSLNFCAWKDRKSVAADLRRIYEAPTADQAAVALDAFEAAWGDKYASIAPAWRRAWEEVTPFFAFPPAVRKIIYTTNAIESLNRMRRENSVPHCFLTLHIPKIDQDPRLIPDRGSRHQTDLSRHPQLRERRQKCPRMVCGLQSIRYHVRGTLPRVTAAETRMARKPYTEFRTLPVMIVAFRRHSLLPLDDCLYALQPAIPGLTRSSLHRCLQRHGISRLPNMDGDAPAKKKVKAYPIGFFHIDIAEVRSGEGKLYMFVAIDRTSKFAVVWLYEQADRPTAVTFLETVLEAVPYKINFILTDNIQFAD
jgi:Transposase, Mutator family